MNTNTKIIFLAIGLFATMYYFITVKDGSIERVISMLLLAILAYLLGRQHQNKIDVCNLPNEPNKHQTSHQFQSQ